MIALQEGKMIIDICSEARKIARQWGHDAYGIAHLLGAIMGQDTGLSQMLDSWGIESDFFAEWAEMLLERIPKAAVPVEMPTGDSSADQVLEEAEKVRLRLGLDEINAVCVLVAVLTPGVHFSIPQLKISPVSANELVQMVADRSFAAPTPGQEKGYSAVTPDEVPVGSIPYCINWRKPVVVEAGKRVVGREREIRNMGEALNRHQATGVLITGDSGVGKTALIQGYIAYLTEQEATDPLAQAQILKLDIPALMAGASAPGEVEGRLGKVFAKAKKLTLPLLIIDDLNILLDDRGGNNHVPHVLNAGISESGVAVITSTTTENYTKRIEPHPALLRKLEIISIAEPDQDTTIRCLEVHRPALEQHHRLQLEESALREATHLAKRYLKEKKLPDSALSLLDRTLSAQSQSNQFAHSEHKSLWIDLEKLKRESKEKMSTDELLRACKWLNYQIQHRISPVLLGQITLATDPTEIKEPQAYLAYLNQLLEEIGTLAAQTKEHISALEIASMVAHQTGIPMGKIRADEMEKLLHLETHLKRRVVGQDQAISALADAILESRSGLNATGKPIGSFFFLGPTGTGKTELCKTLAEFLFDDESAMIRFDMSEFKEEHSAALLYGAPPGYVGYEEGGLLVNKIRQQPYSVVLFDEIEKAHPSVFDIFLQIMDEGHVHDRLGKKGSFTDAIIIFTSNLGSEWIAREFGEGRIPASSQLIEIMAEKFRPEFLGRLTEVVPFGPITEETVLKIFQIQLQSLREVLTTKGIQLSLSDAASQHLSQSGYSFRYGARPIASVIRNEIRRPISRMVVAGKVKKGSMIQLDVHASGELTWDTTFSATPQPQTT